MRSSELFNNSPLHIEGTFQTDKAYDNRYRLKVTSKTQFTLIKPEEKTGIKGTIGKPIAIDGAKFLITLNDEYIKSKKHAKIIDTYEFEFLSKEKLMAKINKDLDIVPVDKDDPSQGCYSLEYTAAYIINPSMKNTFDQYQNLYILLHLVLHLLK